MVAASDPSSSSIVPRQVLYVMELRQDLDNGKAMFTAVSQFLMTHPVLSFGVREVTYSRLQNTELLPTEEESESLSTGRHIDSPTSSSLTRWLSWTRSWESFCSSSSSWLLLLLLLCSPSVYTIRVEQSSYPTDMMSLMLMLIAGILLELLYWSHVGQLSLEGIWGGVGHLTPGEGV